MGGRWAENWWPCFSLFHIVYRVFYYSFSFPPGAIGRLCFMTVAPPAHLLY